MKIQIPDISDQQTIENMRRFIAISLDTIVSALNGNLTFSDNFNSQALGVTFPVVNTELVIPHQLNRVPIGYFVTRRSAAMTVYDSTTAWTATNIYLKSSAIGGVNLMVF